MFCHFSGLAVHWPGFQISKSILNRNKKLITEKQIIKVILSLNLLFTVIQRLFLSLFGWSLTLHYSANFLTYLFFPLIFHSVLTPYIIHILAGLAYYHQIYKHGVLVKHNHMRALMVFGLYFKKSKESARSILPSQAGFSLNLKFKQDSRLPHIAQ